MNQEFNPRLLWNCAEPYLSQTLRDIKGPGGVVFWVCCDISGWLSGGVVRGVVAISEAGGPRLGAHRPWWLSVRQGVGVLEMESGQAQNMVISKKGSTWLLLGGVLSLPELFKPRRRLLKKGRQPEIWM